MNLQQLYYFKTIAELEHYTKAAEQLMVTQPSLSRAIGELEAELDVHLFERCGRGVRLTKYGAIFLEYVVSSLATLEEGKSKLADFVDPAQGTISLAYLSSLEEFLCYVVSRYATETGRSQVKFQFYQLPSDRIESSLLSGTADLAFATEPDNELLRRQALGEHGLELIVPEGHPLARQRSVDISTLGKERFITYDYQCMIRRYIDNVLQVADIRPNIISETTHDTIIYSSVAAGLGVALVPRNLNGRHPVVKALAIENELPPREIHLVWKQVRYMSPAVKSFRDYILGQERILDQYKAYYDRKTKRNE